MEENVLSVKLRWNCYTTHLGAKVSSLTLRKFEQFAGFYYLTICGCFFVLLMWWVLLCTTMSSLSLALKESIQRFEIWPRVIVKGSNGYGPYSQWLVFYSSNSLPSLIQLEVSYKRLRQRCRECTLTEIYVKVAATCFSAFWCQSCRFVQNWAMNWLHVKW